MHEPVCFLFCQRGPGDLHGFRNGLGAYSVAGEVANALAPEGGYWGDFSHGVLVRSLPLPFPSVSFSSKTRVANGYSVIVLVLSVASVYQRSIPS